MKVLELQAHNVMRLSDVNFDLNGHHLYVVGGKNGQGKTSSLTALLMALCGRSGMDDYPEVALKDGEEKGWVKVRLSGCDEIQQPGGMTVELLLKRKRGGQVVEEFRILDSEGEEAPEPRTLLKRLYDLRAFDPLAFERMDKKAKKDLLTKLLGIDLSADKREYDKVYQERESLGREGKKLKGAFESLTFRNDVPAEEVTTPDLLAELDRRTAINDANRTRRQGLHSERQAVEALQLKRNAAEERIEQLRRALEEAEKEHARLDSEASDRTKKLASTVEEVEALKDESTDEIRQKLKDADATNKVIRDNQQWKAKKAELEASRKEYEGLTDKLKGIEDRQQQKLRDAKWPVEGLSMDDSGVLYEGLPIEQVCRSMRTRISVKIGMAINPKLRLLVSQCGGDFDADSLAELDAILREHDFQMILELATRSDTDESLCAVVIKDGAVKKEAVAA